MKNYRPDDWDKVNPKPIGTSMACAFNREDMYKHGEACADAMLEALKHRVGSRRNKGNSGWLVFIPDEAKE